MVHGGQEGRGWSMDNSDQKGKESATCWPYTVHRTIAAGQGTTYCEGATAQPSNWVQLTEKDFPCFPQLQSPTVQLVHSSQPLRQSSKSSSHRSSLTSATINSNSPAAIPPHTRVLPSATKTAANLGATRRAGDPAGTPAGSRVGSERLL
jgi:hypothetical protein